MNATAWSNGGGTYGIRVGSANRDKFFDRRWSEVEVELDGTWHNIPISGGFWNKCPEIRSPAIRDWLRRHGQHDWPRGQPSKLQLIPVGGNRFRAVL